MIIFSCVHCTDADNRDGSVIMYATDEKERALTLQSPNLI
jgi:hypothetical protein